MGEPRRGFERAGESSAPSAETRAREVAGGDASPHKQLQTYSYKSLHPPQLWTSLNARRDGPHGAHLGTHHNVHLETPLLYVRHARPGW